MIAHVWDGSENRRPEVYVTLAGTEKPLRLTYSRSGVLAHPACLQTDDKSLALVARAVGVEFPWYPRWRR